MCLKQGRLSLKNAFLYVAGFPNHVPGEKAELELMLFNDAGLRIFTKLYMTSSPIESQITKSNTTSYKTL